MTALWMVDKFQGNSFLEIQPLHKRRRSLHLHRGMKIVLLTADILPESREIGLWSHLLRRSSLDQLINRTTDWTGFDSFLEDKGTDWMNQGRGHNILPPHLSTMID
tara:strand:- start:347 stop:664 length:318 start_codon:yes stop_codon:yes gene_type:complete